MVGGRWGTLVVNLTGSFVLGLLTGLSVTGDALLLFGTGLLGAYTTFSTWMVESLRSPRLPLSMAAGWPPPASAGSSAAF